MADSIITNRRSLIKAFPFFGGAALLPASIAFAAMPEASKSVATPRQRVIKAIAELKEAMNEYDPSIVSWDKLTVDPLNVSSDEQCRFSLSAFRF